MVASVELVVATILGVFAFSKSITVIKIIGILFNDYEQASGELERPLTDGHTA